MVRDKDIYLSGERMSEGEMGRGPLISPPFKGMASQYVRISRSSLGLLW
jgi:hypothetical protein